MDKGGAKAERG